MFCNRCGRKLSDNASFCTACGASCSGNAVYYQSRQTVQGGMATYLPNSIGANYYGTKKKNGALKVVLAIVTAVFAIGLSLTGSVFLLGKFDVELAFWNKEQSKTESVSSDEIDNGIASHDEEELTTEIEDCDLQEDYPQYSGTDYVQWTNSPCDSSSTYAFGMKGSSKEIITPSFESYGSSIWVTTVLEFEEEGNVYTDKSRCFEVTLYDETSDLMVGFYTGMYDNIEGGLEFHTKEGHIYHLKITTAVNNDEKINGHGHIYL